MTRIDIEQVKKMRAKMTQNGPMFTGGKYVEPKPKSKFEEKFAAFKAGKNTTDEKSAHLFYYTLYTFVDKENYETLTEEETTKKLKQFPETEVYFCRIVNSNESAPSIIRGRKNLHTEEVEGVEQLSDLIFQRTNVKVPDSDLMTEKMRNWKTKSLFDRIKLMNQVEKPKIRLFAKYTVAMENAKYQVI